MATVVFGGVILFSLALAMYSRRGKSANVEDYLVGGRSFSGILLFFLAVGEVYSIGTMIGFPGGIYAKGVSYGIWFLGYILLAYPIGYFLAPLIWRAGKRYNAMTMSDVVRSHYSHRVFELIFTISVLLFMIPWGQLQFQGLIVALSSLGFNLSPAASVVIAGCIAFFYISVSGVKAPAVVSVLKDILVFLAIVIAGIAVLTKVESVSSLFDLAKQHGTPVTIQNNNDMVSSMSTIFFQAIAFYAIPMLASAIFTGRSEATVKRTQTFMPLYMFMYPFLVITSYFAFIADPGLNDPNQAFIVSVSALFPSWLTGFVAAGAALSGILVLAVSSLSVGAFVSRNLIPNVPETSQRRWVQMVVLLYLVSSMALTLFVPSLMLNIIHTTYYGYGQFVPTILAILFFRRITPIGLAAGLIIGDVAAISMHLNEFNLYGINNGLIALVLNFVVTLGVSYLTKDWKKTNTPIAYNKDEVYTIPEKNDSTAIVS
ncbi:sodium:solute symporter family protein [Aneurinibacillus migulanus]|uniref:sodium:solute symporter family protein n=1 Tax=Aneurinibacillus migulanus TaxID=47500 RepID=UPI0006A1A0B8|nr:sodium:solute symporter family protein [Aneurinibacillus migulanus]CEH30561.1 Transporter, SSS family [Aneurinibacillus migulanus]